MTVLYVTEPGATVRRRGGSLIVTAAGDSAGGVSEDRLLLEVEPHRLETVVFVGRIHLTAEAARLCLDGGIAVS